MALQSLSGELDDLHATVRLLILFRSRHVDIRLLPSLVPESVINETAALIEPELAARITKLKNLIDAGIIDQENSGKEPAALLHALLTIFMSDETPKSTCPFTFYGHIDSVAVPEILMQEMEEELQRPTGIWTVAPPKLSMTGLLVSQECGLMYEIVNTEGLRSLSLFSTMLPS